MTYIAPQAKVLRHLDRVLLWQRGQKPGPVTVEWDLSNRCSLGCMDCHFAHTHSRGPWVTRHRLLPMACESTGDLAEIGLVDRVCAELKQAGVRGVIWSGGGEPTLHPRWEEAVLLAAERHIEQGMYTLGGHFTPDTAGILASTATFVVVSLDACDADTYAAEKGVSRERFAQACQGIRWLSAVQSAAIGVSFLIHGQNWRRMGAMLELARSLGATYTTFRPAIRFHRQHPILSEDDPRWITVALRSLRAFADEPDVEVDPDRFVAYRDWTSHGYDTCYGIRLNTTITPDGRVWVCPNRRGMAQSCLGDLREESFGRIWARHPGHFAVNDQCRVMCRLHPLNQTLTAIDTPRAHEAFI